MQANYKQFKALLIATREFVNQLLAMTYDERYIALNIPFNSKGSRKLEYFARRPLFLL